MLANDGRRSSLAAPPAPHAGPPSTLAATLAAAAAVLLPPALLDLAPAASAAALASGYGSVVSWALPQPLWPDPVAAVSAALASHAAAMPAVVPAPAAMSPLGAHHPALALPTTPAATAALADALAGFGGFGAFQSPQAAAWGFAPALAHPSAQHPLQPPPPVLFPQHVRASSAPAFGVHHQQHHPQIRISPAATSALGPQHAAVVTPPSLALGHLAATLGPAALARAAWLTASPPTAPIAASMSTTARSVSGSPLTPAAGAAAPATAFVLPQAALVALGMSAADGSDISDQSDLADGRRMSVISSPAAHVQLHTPASGSPFSSLHSAFAQVDLGQMPLFDAAPMLPLAPQASHVQSSMGSDSLAHGILPDNSHAHAHAAPAAELAAASSSLDFSASSHTPTSESDSGSIYEPWSDADALSGRPNAGTRAATTGASTSAAVQSAPSSAKPSSPPAVTRDAAGNRTYLCKVDGCNRSFTRKYNLDAHLRSHAGEKPEVCKECGRSFNRRHDLNRHISSVHNKTNKYGPCERCHARFPRQDAFKRHLETCGRAE
ncbi:hypothetical protein HK105_201016 [Polyrhizophydium stewartii]|uniref:C2H2-type domain-containing protein n=1 Tax=Polyrhizophydium stewartii TaxID=2732419 RepID=A0ABR4NIK9_9FUNG